MYNPDVGFTYETEAPGGPAELGPYREGDYARLPDEPRCELLYGHLVVNPSPNLRHQRVLGALNDLLRRYAGENGGQVFFAPLDVRLAEHSIVQPDLIYVSQQRRDVLQERIFGAPDLVVEVLSPSTARRDLGAKLRLYAEAGIAEYWVIDPANRTCELLTRQDGGEGPAFRLLPPESGIHRSRALPGLAFDSAAFWSEIDD